MFLLLVSGFDSPFNLFEKNHGVWYIESTATIPRSSYVALQSFKYSHLLVITGYKWDYTFYKWGYKYL